MPPVRAALLALALCTVSTTARADEAPATSYAVIAFDVTGNTDATLRAKVESGLVRGVAEAGADLVGYDAVQKAIAGKAALAGCVSATCLGGIAQAVGTDQLLEVTITVNGANYQLTLALVTPSGAVRKRSAACTVCTVADLADLASTRITDLLTAVAGAPVPVAIDTNPSGATLSIAGVGAATAPWKGDLAPGAVEVDAHLAGYGDAHQSFTVADDDGSEQRFDLTLSPLAVKPPRFHRLKWIAAGGGAAVLVTGLVLLALDGSPTCSASGASCPDVYQTGLSGTLFTIVGLAGSGAAGWMFWQDHRHREATAAVAPTAGGAVGSVRVRF